MAKLRDQLVMLADAINKHSEQIDKPAEALRRVQQTAEEISSGNADRSVVLNYLDRILSLAGKVHPIVQAISAIKTLMPVVFGS